MTVSSDLQPRTVPLTPQALTAVFIELRPRLERIAANRVGSPDIAADLVQDLYLRLPRISEPLATPDDARRYLIRMAINAALNHLSIEGRRSEILEGVADLYDSTERSPEDIVLAADSLRAVEAALRELPEKCREMLFLSRVEGLTHAEIAARMNVSRSLVEKYLVKAMVHCRAKLP
ncbi:MAG TPA: RNA polymerase sigma factor [Fontimonas sp.]